MCECAGVKRTLLSLVAGALAVGGLGCSSSTQPSREAPAGQIVVVAGYSPGASGSRLALRPGAQYPATSGVDSVIVTRVRLALRDIKFKTQGDSAAFRTAPLVMEINVNGVLQNVVVADVPFGTYHRIEFDIHPILAGEVALRPSAEQVLFQDFLGGDGKSVIIAGRVYQPDGAHNFTFYSDRNVNQKIELSPMLEVSETSPAASVTLKVTAGDWFRDSKGGLLDPRDPSDANAIANNISRSIHVFKDTNRDGNPD